MTRDKIKSPPKGPRIRYPDEVTAHEDFPLVVSNCEKVLEDRGIIVVGCKRGIRKAPTIAMAVGRKSFNAYTVHCSLLQFTKTDMMLVLSSCLTCPKARDVRRQKITEGAMPSMAMDGYPAVPEGSGTEWGSSR